MCLAEAPLHTHRPAVPGREDRVSPHRFAEVLEQHVTADLPRERRTGDAVALGLRAAAAPRLGHGRERALESRRSSMTRR